MQRRLSLLKQWSKERFGGQKQTQTSDEFKALEAEMQLRYNGLNRLHSSTKTYLRWLSKRYTKDHKDKQFPIGQLGAVMIEHGNDFDDDVDFGQCLTALGKVEERLARIQEAYLANATSCWLESLEHSLSQQAEYQDSRKKLESKRLAYDASRSQLQSSKKDDPRLEVAVMTQKRQYIDVYREVLRVMREISDSKSDSIVDLTSFVGAQIAYHERCHEALSSLREQWPAPARLIEQSVINEQAEPRYRSARSMASSANLYQQQAGGASDTSSTVSSES